MIIHFPRSSYGDFARREGCLRNEGKQRPEWLRKLPKPSGVIGYNVDQVGCFLWAWSIRTHYADSFYCFTTEEVDGFDKLAAGSVLFCLPYGGWMSETTLMKQLREQRERAGVISLSVPMNIARGEPWPIEESMCISTQIHIANKSLQLSLDESAPE